MSNRPGIGLADVQRRDRFEDAAPERGDEAVEAAKRAFRVPPSFDYEFVYDEDAHANATVYVDPVSSGGGE